MDFNTIYELVAPYLGTTGIAGIIITILMVVIKCRSVMKKSEKAINDFILDIKSRWNNTENEALKAFKSALPKDLFINIETLAKSELSAIKEDIWNAIDEKWLGQITKNTELTQAIATALLDNKTITDSDKVAIAGLLNKSDANTTKSLKVELLPIEEKVEEIESTNILID
jgi:hypothetical protein